MFQHDEYEQHLHGDRRHGKEIDGHHLTEMVVEKGLPRLTRWPAEPSQNSGDGAFGDRDAEHLQFAMNPRCTPQRIGGRHSFDQSANLGGCSGPTSLAIGLITGPRICETVRAASGRRCQPGHRLMDGATRTTSGATDRKDRQDRSLTFSMECRELQPESGIFDRHGLMTAQ